MRTPSWLALGCGTAVIFLTAVFALAQDKGGGGKGGGAGKANADEESERKVTEAEVPKAALEALKKLAGGAPITEFAEEVEHGHKFYEGSWAGAGGNVDGLVTESGDVVEIEESMAADKVPAAVRAEAEKTAGKDAKVSFEKKTLVIYEIHYTQGGKGHELVLTPDARRYQEGGQKEDEKDKDEDEDK